MARRLLHPARRGVDAGTSDGPLAADRPGRAGHRGDAFCPRLSQAFAALAGASDKVPTDRPLNGVDASKFLLGESEHTGREDLAFFGPDGSMMSAKWHNMKIWLQYAEGFDKPIVKPSMPMVYDLGSDPGENYNLFNDKMDIGWEAGVVLPVVFEYKELRPVPEHQAWPGIQRLPSQGPTSRPVRSEPLGGLILLVAV